MPQCEPNGRFRVTLADGTSTHARKLLVATGVCDNLPEIPGFRELYGRSVFHCPYCDGWEIRDQPIAIYGKGASRRRTLAGTDRVEPRSGAVHRRPGRDFRGRSRASDA